MKTIFRAVALIAVIVALVWYGLSYAPQTELPQDNERPDTTTMKTITYACDANKTLTAAFTEKDPLPPAGEGMPPSPQGTVQLTLSDGRAFDLAQTLSADGVRFANPDESFIFWSKGNGALVLENNVEKNYVGCIQVINVPADSNLTELYSNSAMGFSIRYPLGYTVDESYKYQVYAEGSTSGVKFTIPAGLREGTNLSSDSYISVEQWLNTTSCSPEMFLEVAKRVEGNVDVGDGYEVASASQAAAGNRYDETIYARVWSGGPVAPCMAIRYYIHSTNIQNYDPGTIREFDRAALLKQFDEIRHTLVLNQ